MISTKKFWIPVIFGMLGTVIGVLWVVMMLLAGGAHGTPDPNTPALGTLLFPFAALLKERLFPLAAIAFLAQFPIYGAIAGDGNLKGKLKPYLFAIAVVHILALILATFFPF